MIATIGDSVSTAAPPPILKTSEFDAVLGLSAISENTAAQTDTIMLPVESDGVTVTLYPVALCTTKLLTTPLDADISAIVRSAVSSLTVMSIETAPVIVLGDVVERTTLGAVVSSTHVSIIPDATTGVSVPPE